MGGGPFRCSHFLDDRLWNLNWKIYVTLKTYQLLHVTPLYIFSCRRFPASFVSRLISARPLSGTILSRARRSHRSGNAFLCLALHVTQASDARPLKRPPAPSPFRMECYFGFTGSGIHLCLPDLWLRDKCNSAWSLFFLDPAHLSFPALSVPVRQHLEELLIDSS